MPMVMNRKDSSGRKFNEQKRNERLMAQRGREDKKGNERLMAQDSEGEDKKKNQDEAENKSRRVGRSCKFQNSLFFL